MPKMLQDKWEKTALVAAFIFGLMVSPVAFNLALAVILWASTGASE